MKDPRGAKVEVGGPQGRLMRVRNSSRVFCCVRKQPSMQDVTVDEPGFCTPRMVMQRCLCSPCQYLSGCKAWPGERT